MFTSCFARIKQIPADLEPVCIARGKPAWYKGRVDLRLAPTWDMLKMSLEGYNEHFDAILAALDARALYDELGDRAVLLCWEAPNVCCHRRRVAEWFESELGVVVPELGLERAEVLAYAEAPLKAGRVRKTK